GRQRFVEEVRFGEAEIDQRPPSGKAEVEAQILAAAEQVSLAETDLTERTFRRREPDTKGQFTGRLLLDFDIDADLVGVSRRLWVDLHVAEVTQVLDALFGALQLCRVERVALDQAEFAPDHFVQRPDVAGNVDPVDEDARPFLDFEGDIHDPAFRIAIVTRPDID